jgi:tetratricopeptide (TPR) repeat protein
MVLAESKTGQAYRHIERGENLERQGRLDEAMLEFKQAIEADPSIPGAHVALGQHYRRKGLLTKSADEFHTAALLSGDYLSYFELGRVLAELERFDEAGEAFEHCLTLETDDPSARYELASVLYARGAFDRALQQLEALVSDYPDDLELQTAMSDCYLSLADYAAAEQVLVRALERAAPEDDISDLREALFVARRHLEFPPQKALNIKDLLYAEQGIMCLGTRHDNGVDIPVYEDHLFTYSDVAATCRRLVAMQRHFRWPLGAVSAADDKATPLALAVAALLELPTRPLEELREGELALITLAAVAHPEFWQVTTEHITSPIRSFALALTWHPDEGPVTDLIGILCSGKCVLPWQRLRRPSPEAAAASILRAYAAQPDDDNLATQIAYYGREHRLLRFSDDVLVAHRGQQV